MQSVLCAGCAIATLHLPRLPRQFDCTPTCLALTCCHPRILHTATHTFLSRTHTFASTHFRHRRLDHCHCHHHRRSQPPIPPACSKLDVPASSRANDRHVAGESSHLPIFRGCCRGLWCALVPRCESFAPICIRPFIQPHFHSLDTFRPCVACIIILDQCSPSAGSHGKLPGAQACPSCPFPLPRLA